MRTYETTVYDYHDMLDAQNMSNEEAIKWLDIMDRGYFNQYTHFDEKDEFREYTDDEYRIFCMNIALGKAMNLLRREVK